VVRGVPQVRPGTQRQLVQPPLGDRRLLWVEAD
jgi:hypothetical protein